MGLAIHKNKGQRIDLTYLRANGLLLGVIHDAGGLHREVGDILVLVTITHVNLAPLSLPEVGHGTGPDRGLDHDQVVLSHPVEGVGHRIVHFVAVGAQNPGWVAPLAGLVGRNGFQAGLVGVHVEDLADLSISVLNLLIESVASFVVLEDALGVMDPTALVAHLLSRGGRDGQLGVLRLVRLHIEGEFTLFLSFSDAVTANGHKLSAVVDAGNLGAQEELLLLEVEWVRHDFPLKVTTEADLD